MVAEDGEAAALLAVARGGEPRVPLLIEWGRRRSSGAAAEMGGAI